MKQGRAFRTVVLGVLALAAGTAPARAGRVGCRVELDRGVLPADQEQTAIVKVTLDAPKVDRRERPPVNLAVVLDRSGSMSGEKLEKAREAAIEALRRLDKRDLFSLVVYDNQVQTVVSAQRADNTEWIEGRIRDIGPGGNTALFAGVSQGAAEVRKHLDRGYVNRIILLSDGLANVGPSSPEDLGRLGAALIKEDIAVTTVGVGADYNEDLMTRLSQNSDGNSYFVESAKDLPRVFSAELGDVLSVAARRVEIRIECLGDVRPLEIIGRDGRIDGRTVILTLNQMYGGQEKYALVRVKVPANKTGARRRVATATVRYEDALTQKPGETSAEVELSFSKDLAVVERSLNASVQREYELNATALSRDNAITLADAGKVKEAAAELKKSAASLRQAAEKLQDAGLAGKAAEYDRNADDLEQRGWDSVSRKGMRTDNYQIYNQQQQK